MNGPSGRVTFERFNSLNLCSLLPDASDHRRHQVAYMALNLISRISSHEDMRISVEAFGAALGAAALQVGNLLDTCVQLRLPRIFGDTDVLAVENVVDRCDTEGDMSAKR